MGCQYLPDIIAISIKYPMTELDSTLSLFYLWFLISYGKSWMPNIFCNLCMLPYI